MSETRNPRRYVQDSSGPSKEYRQPIATEPNEGMAKAKVGTRGKFPAIMVSKTTKQAKNGEPFTDYTWQDQSGQIDGKWFNTDDVRITEKGRAYIVDAMVSEWNGKKQLTIQSVEPYAGSPAELLPRSPMDSNKLASEIMARVAKFKCPLLKLICNEGLLNCEKEWGMFKEAPGAIMVHHSYIGGLIEHVSTMIQRADALAPLEELDADFIVAGILFHDIGKLWEYRWIPMIEKTDRGQLYGHMALGFGYLTRKADWMREQATQSKWGALDELVKSQKFNDYICHLNHVILSHHEKPEWGAVVAPQTREAILVSRIDVMDALSWRERHLISESDDERTKYDRFLGKSVYSFPKEYPAPASPEKQK